MRTAPASALAATTAFALLVACTPQDPTGAPAEAPADAPPPAPPAPDVSDFSQPLIARGTEPFWAVSLVNTTLTLQRPGIADEVFEAPGAAIKPGEAVWQAKSATGRALMLKVYVADCSDGMSDLRYPMTAEIELAGEAPMRGCAGRSADLPKGQ